jgi:hypothetical protein
MSSNRMIAVGLLAFLLTVASQAQAPVPVPSTISFEPRSSTEIIRRISAPDDPNVVSITFKEDTTLKGCDVHKTCEVDYATKVIQLARMKAPTGKKLTVLVFVHGWKHDSSWKDENYQNFREAIDCLNWGSVAYQSAYGTFLESNTDNFDHISCRGIPARRDAVYLGVYIGWQGRRLNGNRSEFTLKDRYSVAKQTAAGSDILETFKRIHDAAKDEAAAPVKARLVYMGHSFGGLIVEKVASRILTPEYLSKNLETCTDGSKKSAPYTELFMLINPASTGYEGTHLIQNLKKASFCNNAEISQSLPRPWILSIHSNSDIATGRGGVWLRTFLGMEKSWDISDLAPEIRTKYIRASTLNNELFATNVCYLDGTAMRSNGTGLRTGSEYCEPIASMTDVAKGRAFDHADFTPEQRVQSYYDNPAMVDGAYEIIRESCGKTVYYPDRDNCTSQELAKRDAQMEAMQTALSGLLAFTPASDHRPNHLLNLYRLPDPGDLWNSTPYWVVNVSDLMIQGHGGFWNSDFTDFAGSFIDRIPDVP